MYKNFVTSAFLSSVLLSPIYANQNDSHIQSFDSFKSSSRPNKNLSLLVAAGYEFGGEKLLEIDYFDGSSDVIRTGNGLNLSIGGEFSPGPSSDFSIRALAGVKFISNRTSNVDATLYRFPIELSANWYLNRNLRLGLGYVEHLNTKLDSDFGNTDFEDASGPKYEIAYRNFALSYTDMNYVDENGFKYGANTIGLSYSYRF